MVPIYRHARHWLSYIACGGSVLTALLLYRKQSRPVYNGRGNSPSQQSHANEEVQSNSLEQTEHAPVGNADQQCQPSKIRDIGDTGKQKFKDFLGHLRINDWLTFFVGSGSLIVSYLTYLNVSDTRDIRRAVSVGPISLCCMTELSQHHANGCPAHERQGRTVQALPILGQPAAAV